MNPPRCLRPLFSLLVLLAGAAAAGAATTAPSLVVVISVDQLRADYLERFAPYFSDDGFNRLAREGLTFADSHYRHSLTKTGPGHAVMLTGVHANIHGIIANEWLLRTWPALEQVNCVEDRDSPLVGAAPITVRSPGGVLEAKTGRSPRHLLASTVGDQLKLRYGPAAKVFGVADKDRAAILMTGKLADGAYWTESGRVVTSTFYRAELPTYFTAFNAEQRVEQCFGREWTRLLDPKIYEAVQGPDDAEGEASEAGLTRTFPKRIDGGQKTIGKDFYEAYDHTPWDNELVADMARELIVNEKLGQADGAPDLLAVGFSQTDKVGHGYGPDSHEIMDAIVRLDRTIADLLKFIDGKVGLKNCTIVLTADHGVAPLPERIQAMSRDVATGRVKGADIDQQVFAALDAKFGALSGGERWAARDGLGYHLNPAALAQKQLAPEALENAVREAVLQHPAVAAAYTRTRLADPAPLNRVGEAMRLSYFPPRSPDVMTVLKPYFIDRATPGTTHGTPYDYDNHVPLLWFGVGVKPGVRTERVGIDDLAPTLAHILGVPEPPLAEGRVLF
ncbi:MAG: alkaline phosphatase family protein [Lacunisphaera sp.]|nr:alkaline phosphatase family protein [Lacunisphaera sp.]